MKKILILLGIIFAVSAGSFYWKNLRGSAPASLPLTLPDGFSISIFARNIPDARVLAWDPTRRLLVSSPATGKVFGIHNDGSSWVVVEGLNNPHGLAFKDGKLYVAETDAVAVYDYDGTAKNRKKIIDLPGGGNHFSRTIGFGPDGRLYIAVGSSCNVCVEKDDRRAKILVANADGRDLKTFASGLRNAVFFTWSPLDKKMWATDMGRDLIGDNIPPEEVNIVRDGKHYGWPYCWGNRIHDDNFDPEKTKRCDETLPPVIEYQAHSAPLGLAFDKNYLYVAMHGSWNRTEPTGYKIVRFDVNNNYAASDFISGWLQEGSVLGRPVDLLFDDKGALYVSDDKAGVIYRVTKI